MNPPAHDPARRAMPPPEWPELDRDLWLAACAPGDALDEGGRAAGWAAATRRLRVRSYGHWLTFLGQHGELDRRDHPADRVTPRRVHRYVDELRRRNAPMTVWSRVDQLGVMLGVMAPDQDRSWLRRIANRLRAMATPVRRVEPRLRSARELFEEGRRARAAAAASDLRPVVRATGVRDGIMIAFLAACPLRHRSFAGLTLDRHVVRHRDGAFAIRLEPCDVKNAVALDFPLPPELGDLLEAYLTEFRPLLAGGSPSHALWMARDGRPLAANTIGPRIRELTDRWLGAPLSIHLFRHAAATSMAIADPRHVQLVAALLGHGTARTAERYYNKARALEAAHAYHRQLDGLKRRLRVQGQHQPRR